MRRRPATSAIAAVCLAQLLFTVFVRAYVVPHLAPTSHWQYGLQHLSDSQYFHNEAAKLAADARAHGAQGLMGELFEGLGNARVIALVYYVFGSDNPWFVYILNVPLAGLTVFFLILIGVGCGIPRSWAALLAAVLGLSPLFLFLHSELLREPFFLPGVELTWLACLKLIYPEGSESRQAKWTTALVPALGVVLGFVWATTLRPYLLLPFLGSITLVFLTSAAWRLISQPRNARWRLGHACLLAALVAISTAFVAPSTARVQQYTEHGAKPSPGASAAPASERARSPEVLAQIEAAAAERSAALQHAPSAAGLTRQDVLVPHVCSIKWQASAVLPGRVERTLESLACAREEYQRYCDPAVYGVRIDRNCDMVVIASAGQLIRHLPYAVMFSLLAPFPDMWLAGFGSGGTGLRRAGYVIDGVSAYLLLPGFVGLFIGRRGQSSAAPLIWLALGLLLMIVSYGVATPTQFILARLRLAFYIPVLIVAAAGWRRIFAAWQTRGLSKQP